MKYNRITVLYGIFFLVALLLVSRLYFLQVMNGQAYSDQADRQYTAPGQSIFGRGSIYFKDKDEKLISAGTLKSGFVLTMNPKNLENPKEAYDKLSSIVEISRESFFNKANKKDDPYEELIYKLDSETAEKIESLEITGIKLYKQRWRFYPGESLACHTLGFLGFEGDSLEGRYGIERYYNDILQRENSDLYVNFFAEVF